jgi:predicted MFS family arabinose efflux permease
MIYRIVFCAELPTLALLALGASEAQVGIQRALLPLAFVVQLPALRLLGRVSKRSLLVGGQVAALAGSLPLLFFGALQGDGGVALALAAFAGVSLGLGISDTAWFALLHGYQEPERTGRFFATLRAGWHLALIAYFLAAQRWLALAPGAFGPLFAAGFALGVLRVLLITRLPERSERAAGAVGMREALALLARDPRLRLYLAGTQLAYLARGVGFAFALVLLRRVLGMGEGEILWTTVAIYAGGLLALVVFGRVVDAVGPGPVFRWTALAQAALVLGLAFVDGAGRGELWLAVGLFFAVHAAAAGFDVADTHVLFSLAPEDAPARTIVVAQVFDRVAKAAAPFLAGLALERALAAQMDPLTAYRALFAFCALATLLSLWPLARLTQRPSSAGSS